MERDFLKAPTDAGHDVDQHAGCLLHASPGSRVRMSPHISAAQPWCLGGKGQSRSQSGSHLVGSRLGLEPGTKQMPFLFDYCFSFGS